MLHRFALSSRSAVLARSSSAILKNQVCWMSSGLKDSYENILVEIRNDNKVGLITLNRPKALNALSDGLFDDLIHATKALDANKDIGCMVLTGSDKAFAAGADISEMQDLTFAESYGQVGFLLLRTASHHILSNSVKSSQSSLLLSLQNMLSSWIEVTRLGKPIIAAVNGYALGGGCELAMMCDFIIAGDSARFGQPEINLGIIAGSGGTQRLTHLVGKSKSMYMNLTGLPIKAEEAERSGLVAMVVPAAETVNKALELADLIASKGRLSVMMAKEAVNASQELSLQEGVRLERRLFQSLFATDDQTEGMKAFLEKRPANFTHK